MVISHMERVVMCPGMCCKKERAQRHQDHGSVRTAVLRIRILHLISVRFVGRGDRGVWLCFVLDGFFGVFFLAGWRSQVEFWVC